MTPADRVAAFREANCFRIRSVPTETILAATDVEDLWRGTCLCPVGTREGHAPRTTREERKKPVPRRKVTR